MGTRAAAPWLYALLLMGSAAPPATSGATLPVRLDDTTRSVEVGRQLEMLADPEGRWTVDEVRSPPLTERFQPLDGPVFNAGFDKTPRWYRFKIVDRSGTAAKRSWILDLGYPLLDYVDLFQFGPAGLVREAHGGDQRPFSEREIDHHNLVFPLRVEPGADAEIYLRIETESSHQVRPTVLESTAFLERVDTEKLVLGVFYGAMLVMLLYHIILLIWIRDSSYFFYVLYIASITVLSASLNALGTQHLWGDSLFWVNVSVPLTLALAVLSSLQFSAAFLETRRHDPPMHRVLQAMILVSAVICALTPVADYSVTITSGTLFSLAISVAILVATIRALLKGVRSARFFLLAWGVYLTGIGLRALDALGLLQPSFLTTYGFQIGVALGVALLSLALADRINLDRRERQQAQNEALEARESAIKHLQQYQQVVDNMLEGVFQASFDGRIVNANPAMASMLGYSTTQELIHNVTDLSSQVFAQEETRAAVQQELVSGSGRVEGVEVEIERPDGTTFWGALSVRAVKDETGAIGAFDGMLADVSTRREKERLAKEREMAEAATRAKSEFLAKMSHEIRTPMNAVIGFTDLALRTQSDARRIEHLQQIRSSSRTLLAIINDILDLSRIEAGKMTLESRVFALQPILERLSDLFTGLAAEKNLETILSISPEVPPVLRGDSLRLEQVLVNLISNAIKFTEQGEVELRASLEGREGDRALVGFTIRDTGVGLTRGQISRLFTPFTQADESTTRKHGGSGLGLAICRQLVEMMGGEIGVESSPGHGSIFHFTVRLGVVDERSKSAFPPQRFRGMRVLVVQPNPAARAAHAEMLRILRFEPLAVANASDALALLGESELGLVLMDAELPGLDGIGTARKMREHPASTDLPIVLLVASGQEDATQSAGGDAISAVLTKPLKPSSLLDTILLVLQVEGRQPAWPSSDAVGTAPGASLRAARILVVEDNSVNQRLARELLEGMGIQVEIATNGLQAVEAVNRDRYDAVLMDVQMPVLDGHEATRRIRENPVHAELPIVAMTANVMAHDREQCLESGMNDFVAKPIDLEEVVGVLSRWIGGPTPRAHSGSEAIAPGDTRAELPRRLPGVDVESALRRLGGNEDLLRRSLLQFAREHPGDVDRLRTLTEQGDIEGARRIAHTLKGVGTSLSILEVAAVAAEMERGLDEGDAFDADGALQRLEHALQEALASLAALAPPSTAATSSAGKASSALEARFAEFGELLARGDFAAEACFASLRAEDGEVLSEAEIEELDRQLSTFDYSGARATLRGAARRLGFAIDAPSAER